MPPILPNITIETATPPQYSIIWLHGLGADGEDFVPIAKELNLPIAVRYIFPHAPKQPITLNGGFVMRAWYDISENDLEIKQGSSAENGQDVNGIRTSQAEIEKIIAAEQQRGIPASHIFLAGFSQGGVIALQTGLRSKVRLGGIIALSTYLAMADSLSSESSNVPKNIPIFMAHGRQDPIVPYVLGKLSRDTLQQNGFHPEWHEYPMQHSVCLEEINDIKVWLEALTSR